MPRSSVKNNLDRFLPSVIACGVLIAAAIAARALLPMDSEPVTDLPQERTPTTTAVFRQQLRIFEGRLARFVEGQALPEEIYDVAVASLPDEIRQQLTDGITVTSEEELYRLLENFTS